MQNFDGFNLHPALLRGVKDLGFVVPTPIQRDGIPPALLGRDVLGAAATGSGKTAAFALPILQRLLSNPRRGVTRALVLAPTRELAEQITEQFNALAKHTPLRAAAVYGGVGMFPQERSLRRGVEVIVACPGRLLDHMGRGGYARLGGLEVLVLDEADRMLDMGFLPDIRRILALLPKANQTLLFSATMPRPIAELAQTLQKNAVTLDIERPAAAGLVEQAIFPVRQDLKSALLLELLRGEKISNALVFTRTKHRADRVAQFLERNGVTCDRVHGDRTQSQRTQAVAGFRAGRTRVLVATDVAARGIDIKSLSHVVNFDVPGQPDDYIHRVGRTGRAGVSGEAFTFVSPEETGDLRAIERVVARVLPRRTVEGFDYGPQPTHSSTHAARPQGSQRPGRDASRPPSRAEGSGRPVREEAWRRFSKPARPSGGTFRARRTRDSR